MFLKLIRASFLFRKLYIVFPAYPIFLILTTVGMGRYYIVVHIPLFQINSRKQARETAADVQRPARKKMTP